MRSTMLASLLLAVGIGTLSTANTVRASPVDMTIPTRIIRETAVLPLPTYSNFSLSCESIALFAPDIHEINEDTDDETESIKKGLPDQLRARCLDYAGNFHATQIDLNLCVGINYQDASLLWSIYGKYSEYCSQCWSAGKGMEMGCTCTQLTATNNAAKMATNSTLDLDLGIGNVNGTLYCTGGIGRKSS